MREPGYGVWYPPTRMTGASRVKKQRSVMRAAISEPSPRKVGASCATTRRPVLATERSIVVKSIGLRLRRSRSEERRVGKEGGSERGEWMRMGNISENRE